MHQSDLKLHADGIRAMSTIVPKVFPEGSGDGKTGARSLRYGKNQRNSK